MLNENQINLLPERICERLRQANNEYLENIGNVIKKIGELRPKDIHQLQQLYNYGADLQKVTLKLAEASGKSVQDIYDMFDIVAEENYNYAKPFYKAKAIQFIPYNENKDLKQYVKSIAGQTVDEFVNLTQHTAFAVFAKDGKSIAPLFAKNKDKAATSLSDTYTKVIDYAVSKVQLGEESYQSAMREVMKSLVNSGIKTVDYATGYTRRLDSAVRQNILWGVKQCNQNTADLVGKEFGADGYEISYHSNPRPSHAEMGGKQYAIGKARTVNGVYYPSFEENAEPLLNEYGCLHFKFSILLGISRPAYDTEQLEKFKANDSRKFEFEGNEYTKYEGEQLQNKIEVAVKRQKELANIAKAAGDDDLRREAQYKINLLTSKYAKLSEASGLPTKMERMQVAGFRRVKATVVNEARADELLYIIPPIKGDAIKPQSIYKELQKSKVGKETWEYIMEKKPNIEITYSKEVPPKRRGMQIDRNIYIYAQNTKTVKVTSQTIIHEITHMKLNIGGDQWAEAVCFAQELLHEKGVLTYADKRDIIKKVKKLYPEYLWRKRNGR